VYLRRAGRTWSNFFAALFPFFPFLPFLPPFFFLAMARYYCCRSS